MLIWAKQNGHVASRALKSVVQGIPAMRQKSSFLLYSHNFETLGGVSL